MQRYAGLNEFRQRGTVDFPIEVHHLREGHPRYEMPYHWHHELELLRVLSGTLKLSLDETEYLLQENDAVLISRGVLHGGVPQNCRYDCIVFEPEALLKSAAVPSLQRLLEEELVIEPKLPPDPALRAAVEELVASMDNAEGDGRLLVLAALYRFFGCVLQQGCYRDLPEKSRASRRKMTQLKQALTYIEEHFSEQITLEQIAAQAGMSPRYFCRFFQELTHRSPIDYLNYYRVEQAGDKLLHSDLSVTEIAYSSGFNDLSYFIRVFKRQKGVTPKKYEERQRGTSRPEPPESKDPVPQERE